MKRTKDGVVVDIWSAYNPREYLLKLVQFEDDKRHLGSVPYRMSLIPDIDKLTKLSWRQRFKILVASIAL